METEIKILLDNETGNTQLRYKIVGKGADDLESADINAMTLNAFIEGIRHFADDAGFDYMYVATIMLFGLDCMTEEEAHKAIDIIKKNSSECSTEEQCKENNSITEPENDDLCSLHDAITALTDAVNKLNEKT